MESNKIIDLIKYSQDSRLLDLHDMIISNKNIYIFGAGQCALNTASLLKEYGIRIAGFCVDSEFFKEGVVIDGLKVFNADELMSGENEFVIGFENRKRALELKESLSKKGLKVYYFEDLFCFRQMDYKFFIDNIMNYQKAYDLLEDELSRKIFVAHINSRISGDYSDISQYDSKLKYGYDYGLLNISDKEVFVDCGAFDGDTFSELLDYTNGSYKKYIAFEPDEKNVEKLRFKTADYNDIVIIQKGVGDTNEIKHFYNDGSLYSNFVDSGLWGDKTRRDIYDDKDNYIAVPVCKMDDTISDDQISTIKMDIEGSELDALKGAAEIIKRDHPKLAICIYHKSEDLFSCALYINFLVGDGVYKYYVRHHSDNITETVLYAIPV